MDPIGHSRQEVFEEFPCRFPVDELRDRECARSVNGDEHMQLGFTRLDLGNVHIEKPDWVVPEALTELNAGTKAEVHRDNHLG